MTPDEILQVKKLIRQAQREERQRWIRALEEGTSYNQTIRDDNGRVDVEATIGAYVKCVVEQLTKEDD